METRKRSLEKYYLR